jgi:predicted RNA-binding Zn ribbon-like protein
VYAGTSDEDGEDVSQEAPGRLELVRAFVNTVDLEDADKDELRTPEGLRTWLTSRALLGEDAAVGDAELRRAVALREGLRELLLANHGDHELDAGAVAVVDAAARRAKLGLRFAPSGAAHVTPAASGVDGALGTLLTLVADSQADGTWQRLKACPWDTCKWAFYDHSRNRSGVWCNMAVCGNRAKAQAFRDRRRGARA